MNIISEHLSKSYDNDLKNLVNQFLNMGEMAQANVTEALQALMDTDGTLANKVIDADSHINLAEQELDDMVVKVLVKRQPVATDLRLIMAISKCVRTWNALAMKPKKSPKWHAKTPKQGKPPSVIQKPTKSAKTCKICSMTCYMPLPNLMPTPPKK